MQLTIKVKLMVAFIVLLVFSGVIYFLDSSSSSLLNERINTIVDKNALRIILSSKLAEDVQFISKREKDIIMSEDNNQLEELLVEVDRRKKEMQKRVDLLRSLSDAKGVEITDNFIEKWEDYLRQFDKITKLSMENTSASQAAASLLSRTKARAAAMESVEIISQIVKKNEEALAGAKLEAEEVYRESKTNMLLLLVISGLVSTGIAFWIISSISRSLSEAKQAISSVAAGNFSITIAHTTQDEIGELLAQIKIMIQKLQGSVGLAKRVAAGDLSMSTEQTGQAGGELDTALQEMVIKLRTIVEGIMQGADNIATASQQMSSTSQLVSQGASEQAASAEEVSSSMEQMASNIQQNTDNAGQTEKIVLQSSQDIEEGYKSVSQTGESMRTIAKKISIIEEIARQTNLLALNAAVEAARAGEHGKGFTVVAAEVRKLAERSQLAANEINSLSHSSVEVAQRSAKLLEQIVPNIERTSRLVQEIAASSIEQNAGATQVNSAIQQLNLVIQQNAASSEEIATSSEELFSQAEQLKEMISFFKIDGEGKSKLTFQGISLKSKAATIPYPQKLTTAGKETAATPANGVQLNMKSDALDQEFEKY